MVGTMANSDAGVKKNGPEPPAKPFLRRVAEILAFFAGLIGSVTAIVASYNQLSTSVTPWVARLFSPAPSNLIVSLVPNLSAAQLYTRIFAEAGLRARSVTIDQITGLEAEDPGIVIIDGGLRRENMSALGILKQQRYQTTSLIGMGYVGALLIHELDPNSVVGAKHIAHGPNDPVVLGELNLPPGIANGLPTDRPFNVYAVSSSNQIDTVAVYDQGSLIAQGAIGFARSGSSEPAACGGSYWPVAQHGRYVLWGFADHPERLSSDGKRLLVNLVKYLQNSRTDSSRSLPAQIESMKFRPGEYSDLLGCAVKSQKYGFQVSRAGTIRLKVNSQIRLALILNGPGQIGYYERKDDVAPELQYTVTQQQLTRGTEWTATVTYFGRIEPNTTLPYSITIEYPVAERPNPLFWSAVGVVGVVLLGVLIFFGLKRSRRSATLLQS